MDLETENRIAAILLKEAAELRRQAQQEGALAYLRQPTARGRPNSRFLNATIRGIEQANRAVEVNEMWQARQKELELDSRLKGGLRNESSRRSRDTYTASSRTRRHDSDASCSSVKRSYKDYHSGEDSSLRDEELEEFLKSRVKRGRGSIGPRMDETGPFLPPSSEFRDGVSTTPNYINDDKHHRAYLGPEKPSALKCFESSDEECEGTRQKLKKSTRESEKRLSKKHKSKDKSRYKKKKKEKQHKH